MLKFFICLLVTSSNGIQPSDVVISDEQLASIFGTKKAPNYEVVSTAYSTNDNATNADVRVLQITSLNRDIRLYLEPVNGVLAGKDTPVWAVQSHRDAPLGVKYTQIPNAINDAIQVYQDSHQKAAITSRCDENGNVHFEGTIGDNLVIRQLPSELRVKLLRGRRSASLHNDFPQNFRTTYRDDLEYDHVLIEIPEMSVDRTREKTGPYVSKRGPSRPKRDMNVPATIFPQILVVIDYDIRLALPNSKALMQYILSFWNAVDLRYRVFENPNIRINIAGIVIPVDANATPYLTDHRFSDPEGLASVDADKALNHSGRYFYDEMTNTNAKRLVLADNYDAIMIMTKLNLCNREPAGNNPFDDCATLGYSFRGGACSVNAVESLVEAVSLVEDRTGYTGIVPAAHELGHLFGAPHDGYKEANKLLCPSYGYIMSRSLTFNENLFIWSHCSAEYLKEFIHSPKAECLFNEPHAGSIAPRILPGRILSLHEQCKRIGASHACNVRFFLGWLDFVLCKTQI
ncbi:venom metalloproteinase 3-like [Copidosoma floridanum]|uniref:venom metalloproteinase 3-like n=1 Tax=Copidosoma floridanum TaxID=29053 RepID=UPI000C6F7ED9|nr:venom metalloproteinase 3-like [Copidosoma floridanum]